MSSTTLSDRRELASVFEQTLREQGISPALQVLNRSTPYRLTGIYRFDGDIVRSVILFDRKNPHLKVGEDVPWMDSYCRMAAEDGRRLEITDAPRDPRLVAHAAREAVQAYAAVLLKTPTLLPLGTLCHYDLQPVTPPPGVFADLEAVAPAVERALWKMLPG